MLKSRNRSQAGTTCAARTSLALIACSVVFAAAPAAAQASTAYYVDGASTAGQCSDSYTAAQAQSQQTPWCTISEAVASVPSGSTIDVAPAVYHEQVTLTPRDDDVTLQGTGSNRPVIDGGWTSSEGIVLNNGVHDVTIDGFEIRNLLSHSAQGYAAGIVSVDTADDTIENNVIHGIHGQGLYAYGVMLGNNDSPGLVHGVNIRDNQIYDVGPGGSSRGIWLLMTTGITVEGNEIYLVRQEGIRDWYGLDNTFTSNRLYLNWVGITLESAVGDLVDNNVAYANVWGYNPKHVSEPSALSMWGLSIGEWSRFWHNTAYGNTHADMALGMNAPAEDYIDVRDNVFASPGDVHLHDFPAVRGPNIIVDYNVYSGSAPIYYTTWSEPRPDTYQTLAALQAALGWEVHGQVFTPAFVDPSAGDFSFNRDGLAPGVELPDAFGAQLGAASVPAATMSWTRYPTAIVASTPEPSYMKLDGAGDGRDDSYWWSSNYNTNASVTFDLGAPKPVNAFVLDIFAHDDARNPQGYSIQVSDDNVEYHTVLSGSNPDPAGSSYKYTLPAPVTARYVRLNLLSSFGGSTLIFSDFEIGLLEPTSSQTTSTGPVAPVTTPSVGTQGTQSGSGACASQPIRGRAQRKARAAHNPRPARRKAHSKRRKAHRKAHAQLRQEGHARCKAHARRSRAHRRRHRQSYKAKGQHHGRRHPRHAKPTSTNSG